MGFKMPNYILITAILFFLSAGFCYPQEEKSISANDIINSINKAVNFLYENQAECGEFKSLACRDKQMEVCRVDSTPFVTTFILYSIKDLNNKKIEIMAEKAIKFLLSKQKPGGVWSYYPTLTADFDDISCVSAILTIYDHDFDDNMRLYEEFRNEEGVVYTWLRSPAGNEIDCEVNSNVLFYFGLKHIEDMNICNYIVQEIMKENYDCCIYCEKRRSKKNYLPLFYVISRAYKHGNQCLGRLTKHIIQKTLKIKREDGSFGNDLDTALALNILLNFNYHGERANSGMRQLLQRQRSNGSWNKNVFYLGPATYYGSEELTTAIAIEALQKYSRIYRKW